jgi:hypothetical protein
MIRRATPKQMIHIRLPLTPITVMQLTRQPQRPLHPPPFGRIGEPVCLEREPTPQSLLAINGRDGVQRHD